LYRKVTPASSKASRRLFEMATPVGVTRQIREHRLGSGERRLGVDHPPLLRDRREVTQERAPVGELGQVAEERKPALAVQLVQPGEEQAAEQLAEHPHRQEERWSRGDPASRVRAMPPGTIMWTCGWWVIAEP
jgi:hypothetical protein